MGRIFVSRARIVAIHACPVWLPQTQTWIHTQIQCLPETVEPHVACEVTQHLDQFQVSNLHCLRDRSRLYAKLEKVLRKLSIRHRWGFLRAVAENTGADIIHSHFGNIGWQNQPAAHAAGARHVVTYYGYDVSMLPTQDNKWVSRYSGLFEEADLFLCEGPHMRRQLMELGCPDRKVQVQHLGVEIDRLRFRPRRWLADEPLRVLIAASFQEKKGIPYALEALGRVRHRLPLQITLIGDATSEPRSQREKQRILDVVRRAGLEPVTRLMGYQPYSVLLDAAYGHHVFISPSVTASNGDTEGGAPVTLIEMMATGMPVVSTSHADIPEVVQYGLPDWLVSERDVEGLTSRLEWLIDEPDSWESILIAGRVHVEREYNAAHQGARLAEIYRDLMDDGR